jgi:hypothetical protein
MSFSILRRPLLRAAENILAVGLTLHEFFGILAGFA